MPRLLEIQRAVSRCLIERDQEAVAPFLTDGSPINRLDIYHNTIFSGLTKALCLTYLAVQRLVGADFFQGVAQLFIVRHPPRAACLNCYGGEFPDFLRDLPAAAANLVVGRRSTAVEVAGLEETAWHFLAELHAGRTIQSAINSCSDLEATATLAQHLALGWFVAFKPAAWQTPPPKQDFAA
jgi:hypothetical protein